MIAESLERCDTLDLLLHNIIQYNKRSFLCQLDCFSSVSTSIQKTSSIHVNYTFKNNDFFSQLQ